MRTTLPNGRDMDELLQFLPVFGSRGFAHIDKWNGLSKDDFTIFPYPNYNEDVNKFIDIAIQERWTDHEYGYKNVLEMIEDESFIQNASLSEVVSMITYIIRGERFVDGHIGEMIRTGKLPSILNRLSEIRHSFIVNDNTK